MKNILTLNIDINKFNKFFLDNFERQISMDKIIIETLSHSLLCKEYSVNNIIIETIELDMHNLKNFSLKGCKIKEIILSIDIDTHHQIQEIQLSSMFSKLGTANECYPYSFVKCKNKQIKRQQTNRVKITMTNITINKDLFKDIYLKYQNNCLKECKFLQDSNVKNWYGLVLKECKVCGQTYYCDCSKKIYADIYNIINKNKFYDNYDFEKYGYSNIDSQFVYEYQKSKSKEKCCDLCCQTIPTLKYDLNNFSNKFAGIYFYYIQKKGIALCIERGFKLLDVRKKEIRKEAEEYIRDIVNYPRNKKWVSETYLYNVVKTLFPNYRVEREYSPLWLNRMRIDIYIHTLNIGIEYQGQQHYKPVEIFGGQESFIKGQERDRLKKQLCKENGLKLIYFKYDEILTEEIVLAKIKRKINIQ